jgi:hypothetical protein
VTSPLAFSSHSPPQAVIAIQQGRITRAMTAVHDARIEFEARRSALSAQGGLRFISEEEEEQEGYTLFPSHLRLPFLCNISTSKT